jgi:hypothetical protein
MGPLRGLLRALQQLKVLLQLAALRVTIQRSQQV